MSFRGRPYGTRTRGACDTSLMSTLNQLSPEFSYLDWSRVSRAELTPRANAAECAAEAASRELIVLLMVQTAPRDRDAAIRQSQFMHEVLSTMLLSLNAVGAEGSEVAGQVRRLRSEEAQMLLAHDAPPQPAKWTQVESDELRRITRAILAPTGRASLADLDEE
jgi:hypothetical protein